MAGEIEDDPQTSLLAERNVVYSDDIIGKKGTKWSAVAHIITGVIGAGVLSLAWSIAQLGWIAGPLAILFCAAVTLFATSILCDCYKSPDSALGPTINHSLLEAARFYFGKKWTWVCGLLQYVSFYGTGIAYIITSATSMREIQRSNCYHKEGANADCHTGKNIFMLIFGIIQIVTSQIPDFHNMTWLSVVAALMSFCYSFIGLALGFSKVIDNRRIKGSIVGVPAKNAAQKIWLVFQALGDIAFAYPYSIILLEIQDTLKSPPPENQTMKKASISAIVITTFFYICCSGFGYAAFGNDTPGNLLTGFYEPFWLVDFANACIVLHLVGGYQVYSQPVFAFVEKKLTQKFPENKFLNKFYAIKLPVLPAFQLNFFRLCFRTFYVISTTAIAMAFPYFNQVLGILGALNFWPMTIYFPVEMYIVQRKIGAWTKKWLLLEGFSMICLIVSVVGLIGSIEGIISAKLAKV
ncbi:putative amino acid permease 7 isoform X1 [Nicotiana tabacum]|uniref:Amino acid permease 7 isoform X1 n=2 Tax=Nicotiana TaxID=4085 RepID=A0A1S3Z1U3_TOBAC|nr:PREDICTED: probable amino acid permease 7 isoform X1 [Nicotiana sylvestris]XP_016458436.1 PREDICTED: probable amino acid permease 7 isoform X1 [Nicotiana tabacum]